MLPTSFAHLQFVFVDVGDGESGVVATLAGNISCDLLSWGDGGLTGRYRGGVVATVFFLGKKFEWRAWYHPSTQTIFKTWWTPKFIGWILGGIGWISDKTYFIR